MLSGTGDGHQRHIRKTKTAVLRLNRKHQMIDDKRLSGGDVERKMKSSRDLLCLRPLRMSNNQSYFTIGDRTPKHSGAYNHSPCIRYQSPSKYDQIICIPLLKEAVGQRATGLSCRQKKKTTLGTNLRLCNIYFV